MQLPDPREGEVVQIRHRPAAFSFFPTYQGEKREGVHSTLFASDPWNLIRRRVEEVEDAASQRQSSAFLVQAKDFYSAAQNSEVSAAKPLLLYYAFLNLAKCFIVYKSGSALGQVHHGLSEKLPATAGALHGSVSIDITKNPANSVFVKFAQALGAGLPNPTPPKTNFEIRSQDFLAQILIGHRVFCQAEGFKERFVSLDKIEYVQDVDEGEVWVRVRTYADDFTRLGYPMTSLSKHLTGQVAWRNVKCDIEIDERRIIEAQTVTAYAYGQRPSQVLGQISQQIRPKLWRSVTAYPPYRKYYVYAPAATQTPLHQLLAIYLSSFYFGSITRYKPEQFDYILRSSIGAFVFEFFANQPSQFLYLMASEFMEQEVAKAAIT